MRIDSSGNVGIGTVSPSSKLHVSGGDANINTLNIGLGAGTNNGANTSIGLSALSSNTSGTNNTAVGEYTLRGNTVGYNNAAFGSRALYNAINANHNTAIGHYALYSNFSGHSNAAVGLGALRNTNGSNNTAIGFYSLYRNGTGNYNVANGYEAGHYIADGSTFNLTGDYNIFIGADTKALADNDQNEIVIGYNATGVGSNSAVLGNDSVTKTVLKGNVGIGTASPAQKLHVRGEQVYLYNDIDTNNTYFYARNSAAGNAGIRMQNTNGSWTIIANDRLRFYDDDSSLERLSILSDGNVGISTTSPNNNLVVSDTVQPSYTPAVAGEYIEIARTSGGDAGFLINKNTGQWLFGIDNSDGTNPPLRFEYSAAGSAHAGFGNATLGLALKSDGNVGIGITNPSTKLQVAGTSQFDGDLTVANSTLSITAAAPNLLFAVPSGGLDSRIFNDGSGNFIIGHGTNSNTPTERLRIDSSGNVGIGSASPAVTLDIVSNDANPVKIYRNGVNASYEAQNNADQVYFGVNTYGNAAIGHALNQIAAPLQITSAGNVGIGVTNPSQPLHILDGNAPSGTPFANGSMLIAGHSTIGLNFYGNDSSAQHIYFGSPSDNTGASIRYEYDGFGSSVPELLIGTSTSNGIVTFGTGTGAEKMRIDASGNVGIGTSSPITKLNIKGDQSANGQLYIEPTNDSEYAGLVIKTTRGADRAYAIFAGGTGTDDLNFRFRDASAGADRMVIDSSGNVGIGTAAPSQKLDVIGRIRSSFNSGDYFEIGSSDSGGFVLGFSGGTEVVNIRTYGDSYFNGGKVGIGTNNPKSILEIAANNPVINFKDTSAGTDLSYRYIQNVDGKMLFAKANDAYNSFTTHMAITTDGSVGIGTPSPSAGLHVLNSTEPTVLFESTNAGSSGSRLQLYHNSATPADNDIISNIQMAGEDSSGAKRYAALIQTRAADVNASSVDGDIRFLTYKSDTPSEVMRITHDKTVLIEDGLVGAPALSFINDINTGMWRAGSDNLRLVTGGTDAIIIDSSQHVGVGIVPQAKFEVDLNQTNGTLVADNYAHFGGQHMSNGYVMGITLGYREANLFYRKVGIVARGLGDTHARQDLDFLVSTATGSASVTPSDAKLTISGLTGNVGIGTASPAQKLHVNLGRIAVTDGYNIGDTDADTGMFPSSNALFFQTAGTTRAAITSAGNVGIGTNNPDSKLHVESSSATGANFILETTHSGGIPLLDLKGAHSAQLRYKDELDVIQGRIDFGDSGTFNFIDVPNNSSTLYLKTGGNVGIGTISPTTRLQVKDSVDNTYESGFSVVRSADGATTWINLRGGATNFNNRNNAGNAGLKYRWFQNSSEKMTLDTNGNLGIGTASPAYELEVSTASNSRITASNTGYSVVNHLQADNTGGWVGTLSNHPLIIKTNNTEKVRVTTAGSVGIGTVSPSDPLHVIGYIKSSIGFKAGNYTTMLESGNESVFGNTAYYGVLFKTNNATRMKITNAGLVGIGTNNPSTELHVKGAGTVAQFEGTGGNAFIQFTDSDDGTLAFIGADGGDLKFQTPTGSYSDKLTIKNDGKVGIGTSNPSAKLHVVGSTSGDSVLKVDGTNGTLFEVVDDLSDSLMSVNDAAGLPVFEVFADNHIVAGRYNQNDFYLDTNGKVGIGNSAPGDQWGNGNNLVIGTNSGNNGMTICAGTSNEGGIFFADGASGADEYRGQIKYSHSNNDFVFAVNAAEVVRFNSNGSITSSTGASLTSGGAWTDASSRELKKDIVNLSLIKASQVVKLLNPVEFSYKAAPEERRVGFIAEDVPDLVASEGRKGLSSMQIVAALTKVVQNQQKEIKWCKEQIEKLTKIK
jgi:hypothetical protein